MKLNKFLMIGIILVSVLYIPMQAISQMCSNPEQVKDGVIQLDQWGEVALRRIVGWDGTILSGSLRATTDEFSMEIKFAPMDNMQTYINVADGSDPYGRSAHYMGIMSRNDNDYIVDLSPMPEHDRSTWENAMALAGTLLDSDEFMAFLDAGDSTDKARNQMTRFAEGYNSPYMVRPAIEIMRNIGSTMMMDSALGRGYLIQLGSYFNQVRMLSVDPPGTLDPEMYVELIDPFNDDAWFLHFDPSTNRCEILLRRESAFPVITDVDWGPEMEKFMSVLLFLNGQIPEFTEYGMLDEGSEFDMFIDLCIEQLGTYEMAMGEPPY